MCVCVCVCVCVCIHIHTYTYYPPSCSITSDWILFPLLYSRIPLIIHSKLILVIFFLFSFYGYTWYIWKFPGKWMNWSYSFWLMPQPQQSWIRIASVTYAAASNNVRSLTQWAGPGMEPASTLQGHNIRFLTYWTTIGTPLIILILILIILILSKAFFTTEQRVETVLCWSQATNYQTPLAHILLQILALGSVFFSTN